MIRNILAPIEVNVNYIPRPNKIFEEKWIRKEAFVFIELREDVTASC